VPCTRARSTPSSAAVRRATGDDGLADADTVPVGTVAAGRTDGAFGIARGAFAAARTSASTIRPSGPLPHTAPTWTFISPAKRRAAGDASTRPPAATDGISTDRGADAVTVASAVAVDAAGADEPVEGIASPGA